MVSFRWIMFLTLWIILSGPMFGPPVASPRLASGRTVAQVKTSSGAIPAPTRFSSAH
jgi:hypothetical protein